MTPALFPLVHKMLGHAAIATAGVGGLVAVDFRDQITTGSIIVAAAVLVVAGLFTVRSRIANVWREEAEGEKAAKERVQVELAEALRERAAFERDQTELRHQLKNDLAARDLQLQALEAKTDLTSALDAIRAMNETTTAAIAAAHDKTDHAIADAIALVLERDGKTHDLLEEIRDRIAPADQPKETDR